MPTWLIFALLGYFISAIVAILDKVILTRAIPKPIFYASFVGLAGLYGLLLIPFGFHPQLFLGHWDLFWFSLASGFTFIIAIYFSYLALSDGEASRLNLLWGSLTPVFILLIGRAIGIENLDNVQLVAFTLLVLGGILISVKISGSTALSKKSLGYSAIAIILFSLSFILIKLVYSQTVFLNGYIIGRMGEVIAGAILLVGARKNKASDWQGFWRSLSKQSMSLFLLNKSLAAAAFILINYAFFLSSVSLVQALSGISQVFILIFAILLSWRLPNIFYEKNSWKTVFVKAIAILLISLGIVISAFSQRPADLAPGLKSFGVTFSKPWSEELGLDWRETFLAILDDLKARKLRLAAYWTEIEKTPGKYDWFDLDWQVAEAERRDAKIILALGQRLPRWPECHIPEWAKKLSAEERQEQLLQLIDLIVNRYKLSPVIEYWQVENEPFLPKFGICPELDKKFLDKEIALVKSLDPRPVIVSASGELDPWLSAANRADIFGTTMYRIIWNPMVPGEGYLKYHLPPSFFHLKANLVKYLARTKDIIVMELQAEPWGPKAVYEMPTAERDKSLSFEQFKENIEYARQVGFREAYLWGAEWWYWEKLNGRPEFWNEARKNFIAIDKLLFIEYNLP